MIHLIRMISATLLLSSVSFASLIARFEANGQSDIRIDRLPALWLEAGEAPTAFLPPGRFLTTWSGQLKIEKRQRLFFSFAGSGKARLQINGKEILAEAGELGTKISKRLRLNPGTHEIEIHYESADNGSAHFRLYWQEGKSPRQSIPAGAFLHQSNEELEQAQQRRLGRETFAQYHCNKCHFSQGAMSSSSMPELQEIAPLLIQVGDRLQEPWLRAWLADPAALRPGTSMPQLFDPNDPQSTQKIADLAAFLSDSKTQPAATAIAADEKTVFAGGAHFHQLGCVACHTLPDAKMPDFSGKRIPLHHVSAKFQPAALAQFLKNPSAYAPHRGMPNFQLSEQEVQELSSFLLACAKTPLPKMPEMQGNPIRGKQLATEHHCYACHAGMPTPEKISTPSLEQIFQVDWRQKGCISSHSTKIMPHIHLTDSQLDALHAFRNKGLPSLSHHDLAESAERKFHSLRCNACHARDQEPATLDQYHSESQHLVQHLPNATEKLDQSRPHMSFIGEMLQTDHITQVISGSLPQKTRPWLEMRMPAYSAHATAMSHGMARWHGINPQEPKPSAFPVDSKLAQIGAELVSSDKGFGCTTCHGLHRAAPTAAFEVQGISFERVGSRLRYEWYQRWMDNPHSITPGTKMPQYAPAGRSPNPTFQNNASQQFDAIWHFLRSQTEN